MVICMATKSEKLLWTLVGLVFIAAIVSVVIGLLWNAYGPKYAYTNTTGYGWNGMMGWGGAWFIFMPMMAAIGVMLLFVFLYFLLSVFQPNHRWFHEDDRKALDILKRRYAEGEISEEEFQTMKKNLGE